MSKKPHQIISGRVLVDEMRFILEKLCEREREGNRPRLGEVRSMLKGNLTLDFADYFKFLKRYHYVQINREDQSLVVTDEGRVVAEQSPSDAFVDELKKHFGSQVQEELIEMEEDETFRPEEPSRQQAQASTAIGPRPDPSVRTERPEKSERREPGALFERNERPEPVAIGKGAKYDSKYTRYDSLGSGGIGTVYKGRHNALNLEVGIKEIKELFTYFNFLQRSEVIRNLKNVVSQMAGLTHPAVVTILDQNVEVAHPYFVMEYLPGGNLKELMAKEQPPIDRCLVLFTQTCYALRAAHKQEVIHGNIKPENLIFDVQGNVRVTDFGITRLLQTDADRPVPQVVTGSLGYLSPEQMRNRADLTVSSDVYSLGILLYEMLTGNLPGRRSPLPSEVNKEIPKEIDDLFDKMTRDSPEERYPDIDAVLDDFYKFSKDGTYLVKDRLILYTSIKPVPIDENDDTTDA